MGPKDFRLTVEDDPFVRDRVRWVAGLQSGHEVFQDDGRPGEAVPAWERLRSYVAESRDFIVVLRLQFRDNIVWLPPRAAAYYLSRGSWGVLAPELLRGSFYVAGVLVRPGIVEVGRYDIPELTCSGHEERVAADDCPHLIKGA